MPPWALEYMQRTGHITMRITWEHIYICRSRAQLYNPLPLVVHLQEAWTRVISPSLGRRGCTCVEGAAFFACKAALGALCGASTSQAQGNEKKRSVQLIQRPERAKSAEIPPSGEPRPKIEINHCERASAVASPAIRLFAFRTFLPLSDCQPPVRASPTAPAPHSMATQFQFGRL